MKAVLISDWVHEHEFGMHVDRWPRMKVGNTNQLAEWQIDRLRRVRADLILGPWYPHWKEGTRAFQDQIDAIVDSRPSIGWRAPRIWAACPKVPIDARIYVDNGDASRGANGVASILETSHRILREVISGWHGYPEQDLFVPIYGPAVIVEKNATADALLAYLKGLVRPEIT